MAWKLPTYAESSDVPEFEPAITTPFENVSPGGATTRMRRKEIVNAARGETQTDWQAEGRWSGRSWTRFGFEGIAEAIDKTARVLPIEPIPLPVKSAPKTARRKRR